MNDGEMRRLKRRLDKEDITRLATAAVDEAEEYRRGAGQQRTRSEQTVAALHGCG